MAKANAPHPLDDLAPKIGKITMQWNDLHLFIFSIFWRLNGDALKSKAIFFAVQADRTQRNMTQELIKLELERVPILRDAALELFNDIGKASGRRNAVVHAMWAFEADWETGTATVFPPSGPKLSRKRIGEELDGLYADLVKLGTRLATINTQIIEFLRILTEHRAQQSIHPAQPSAVAPSPGAGSRPEIPSSE